MGAPMEIQKCTVKAGKTALSDSFQISGLLDASEADFLSAMGDNVRVSIDADVMPATQTWVFPINETTYKNSKYNYTHKEEVSRSSFKFDTRNGKMLFKAQKVDLTGLACPITVTVTIGAYSAQTELDEEIVNGSNKPCPPELMMGAADTFLLSKYKVKFGKTTGTDSLTASGFFTIASDYDKINPFVVTLGDLTLTISGDQITAKNSTESCNKASCAEGGLAKLKLDFAKCTYSLTISNITIGQYGVVPFGIDVFGHALETADLDLGPKMSNSYWELTHYDQPEIVWDYETRARAAYRSLNRYTDSNGYVLYEEEDDTGTQWNFEEQPENACLTGFSMWMEVGVYDAVLDFHDFNLVYWPEELRLGQSHSDSSTFNGLFEASEYIGFDLDLQGTISSSVTVKSKTKSVTYQEEAYQAVQFTEILTIEADLYYQSTCLGSMTIQLKTQNEAVPGIGITKTVRSAKVGAKTAGENTLKDTTRETATLIETSLE